MATARPSRPHWTEDAPCKEVGPEVFFMDGLNPMQIPALTVKVKAFCRTTCPVIDECLLAAFVNEEEFGVFGGTSPRERRDMAAGKCPLPEWADERHVAAIEQVKVHRAVFNTANLNQGAAA